MESPVHMSVVASRSVHAIIMFNARQDIVVVKFVVYATTQKTAATEQVGPLRPACDQNRTGRIQLPASVSVLFLHFFFFFQRRHRPLLCKPDLDPIWMTWSEFGQTHLVWELAGIPVFSRTQPDRYQFPTFRLCSVLPQKKTARIRFSCG